MLKITAIVPVYNVEQYLEECLDSLLSQTIPFDEIILVNDGSTDKSGEICEEYARKNNEIQLIHQENRGLSAARNTGLETAKGDYVVFIDSDDYVSSGMSYRLRDELSFDDVEILFYNADIQYDIPSKERPDAFWHLPELNNQNMTGIEFFQRSFPDSYTVSACVAAYKKSFLDRNHIRFPEGIYFEDHFWNVQVITNARVTRCIPDSLYIRRCREDSIMSSGLSEKKCLDMVKKQELVWRYLAESNVWMQYKDLCRKYMTFEALYTIYDLSQYPDQEFSSIQIVKVAEMFLKYCVSRFDNVKELGEKLAYLLVLKKLKYENISFYFESKEQFLKIYMQLENDIRSDISRQLQKIPLHNQELKIGIYGIGNHTGEFLHWYREKIGSIQCELFFVVSSVNGENSFEGRPVFEYQNIPRDTDFIFLSSKVCQKEMKENLLRAGIPEKKILSLYKKEDICDLVIVNWVLKQ